ncbi:MAG TPA: hypothetical protein VK828_06835 [Terriglobales bacterium]|jgi:hypothetical protein|nr:hypothetical protein [Terriglobales bacterium]
MTPELQSIVDNLRELHPPFWRDPGYVIALFTAIAGLIYSYKAFKEAGKAFREARSAKEAATAAGRTVKIQTVTIELTEVTQMLDRIEPGMLFREARDLLAEVQRRVRRHVAPFAEHPRLSSAIKTTLQALEAAHRSLKDARPADAAREAEAPNAVYNAIEDDFATINNCVADLMGLFEKVTLGLGDSDGEA